MITTTKERAVSITELKKIPMITPDWASPRWKGIQHGELVETIHEVIDGHDIKVQSETWYPGGENLQRLHGSMQLSIPGLDPIEGTQFSLGIQHSNLGDHALKFAVGAKIFICSNGMVTGDYTLKHKHTKGLDLMEQIGIGVDTYLNKVREIPQQIKQLQETGMAISDVDRALMTAGREGLLSWSRIGQVDKEYRTPTFADHDEETAWGLYNAFTYTLQKMPPQYHIKGMNRFREIVTEAA